MRTPLPAGLAVLLLLLLTVTASAAPAVADDRAKTPVERGAFAAMPAVYDLLATIRVDAFVVDGHRRVRVDQPIPVRGTAFGVAPGRVVAARHVVAPSKRQLIDDVVIATGLTGIPTDPSRVRIIGLRRTLSLIPARTAVDGAVTAAPIVAQLGRTSDEQGDLALLTIRDPDAPTLALDDSLTRGTRVAVVGFGDQPSAIPAVRPGRLDGPRRIERTNNDGFGAFDGDVLQGDSGAPVVDAGGRAHGVVLRLRTTDAPVIARAEAVRQLLEADHVTGGESPTITDFRTAMLAFWRRDYPAAASDLAVLGDADHDAPLVRQEQARATALVDAAYMLRTPSRGRGAVLGIGAMATLVAAALGVMRLRRQPLLP